MAVMVVMSTWLQTKTSTPLSITVLLNLTALSVVKMAKAVIVRENVVKILLLMSLWGRVPVIFAAGEIIC